LEVFPLVNPLNVCS